MFSLQDQVAVVTGAAKGIGRGIAETLADAGASTVIADIDAAQGEKTAGEIGGGFAAAADVGFVRPSPSVRGAPAPPGSDWRDHGCDGLRP